MFQTSSSTPSLELPVSATDLLESEVGLRTNATQYEEVKSDKSTYEEIKSQAAKENVDVTGGLDHDGRGEFKYYYLMSLSAQNLVNILGGVEEPRIVIREVVEQHDIGLLNFDKDNGKQFWFTLRTEII